MTTMKKDDTLLEEQVRTLRRSNEVLRQTYNHFRQANTDLMEIIDKFIDRTNPDPRQTRMRLKEPHKHWIEPAPYNMQNNKHIIAHARHLIPFTVMEPRKCPTCETQLREGEYAYWSGHMHHRAYCDQCIPPLGMGPGDINYSDGTTTPTAVIPEQEEELVAQDQAAEDEGYECTRVKREGTCPTCKTKLGVGNRLYVAIDPHASPRGCCRKCFGT